MTKLYSSMARIYHEMYQSIYDYKEQFRFYEGLLKEYGCKKVLEVGCGSGNLASPLLKAGYDYLGLDLSGDVLAIAREVAPKARFVRGDMRNLRVRGRFDAVLITGKSFTYMTTNDDVMKALKSVYRTLKERGIFIFDNFNAEVIFGNFKKQKNQTATYKGRHYRRVSNNSPNLKTGWTWNWDTVTYVTEKGKTRKIEDKSVLRAFTKDEIRLFLEINNFELLRFIEDGSVVFAIARKR